MNIKELRKKRRIAGISQKSLASEIGITQAYYSMLENEKRIVSPELCKKIEELLSIVID